MLPEKRNCNRDQEDVTWTPDERCLERCRLQQFITRCHLKCQPFSFYLTNKEFDDRLPYCAWENITQCADDDEAMKAEFQICQDSCPLPCTKLSYVTHMKENYPWDGYDEKVNYVEYKNF